MHFDSFERHTLIYNYSLFAPVCLAHTLTYSHTHTPTHTHTHTALQTAPHWSYWGFAVWFVWSVVAVIQYASVIHKRKGHSPPPPPPPLHPPPSLPFHLVPNATPTHPLGLHFRPLPRSSVCFSAFAGILQHPSYHHPPPPTPRA